MTVPNCKHRAGTACNLCKPPCAHDTLHPEYTCTDRRGCRQCVSCQHGKPGGPECPECRAEIRDAQVYIETQEFIPARVIRVIYKVVSARASENLEEQLNQVTAEDPGFRLARLETHPSLHALVAVLEKQVWVKRADNQE